MIRRRELITLLGGAAAAWPLAARAQERVRRIGALMPFAESDPGAQARVAVFHEALQKLGLTSGRVRNASRGQAELIKPVAIKKAARRAGR
jgi:hypothetical protein